MKKTISLIAAISDNFVIGNNNALPWHSKADSMYFKKTVTKHAVIMGRHTYDSIKKFTNPPWKAFVVSRNSNYIAKDATVCFSLDEAIQAAKSIDTSDEIFILGGAQLFQQAMPIADKLYLTIIHITVSGDTYFPKTYKKFFTHEIAHTQITENGILIDFYVLEKSS